MRQPALHALATLLDRSLEQIAEAAGDARTFDRELISRVSDVWDNNTYPFFAAASARLPWAREWLARRALRWMADLGERRYAWVLENSQAAGLLGRPPMPDVPELPYWHWLGKIAPPWSQPLSEEALAAYDMTDCRIMGVQAEFEQDRLRASVELRVPRRYDPGKPPYPDTLLRIRLHSASTIAFEAGSSPQGEFRWRTDGGRVEVLLGRHGRLVAESASLHIDDLTWHRCEAGLAAAAVTAPRGEQYREKEPLGFFREGRSPQLAAAVVRRALLDIRTARFAGSVDQRHTLALCRAFDGAGTAALAAAGRGEEGYRALIVHWVERGSAPLAGWFADTLRECSPGGRTGLWAEALAAGLRARPAPEPTAPLPSPVSASLRQVMVAFAGRHAADWPAEATVHFAIDPGPDTKGGGWDLLSVNIDGFEQIHLSPGAFAALGRLQQGPRSLRLGSDFTVSWQPEEAGRKVRTTGPAIAP